jgi:hypothetical protein
MGDCWAEYIKIDRFEGTVLEFVQKIWGKPTDTVSAYIGKHGMKLEPDISQIKSGRALPIY